MTQKERFAAFINYFSLAMPVAETELVYETPFQLLVSVMLSAQCTDKRVNLITPGLFKKYPDAESMSKAKLEEIFELIKSCSYPNNKAKHLLEMSKMLIEEYHGKIPDTLDDLQKLPGVGRKTANVIAAVLYNQPVIPVDTHVFRVAGRIGLAVKAKTPLETERQLEKNIPPELRPKAHHWLILHGRYVCMARNPNCKECGIRNICNYYFEKK